ncbi:interferon-induced protein with tetratricopeptide repeats 1-like [Hemitrygon akajei]|uniref:interferon-induced protein with tetratricopeptide repeats 1-like n=1 Tax=Hemitrygon akajei TaxID=2704970 RepID=UPI003BF97D9C
MNSTQRDLLKEKLDQLQCHFTWGPQKGTIDLEDVINVQQDQGTLLMQLFCELVWQLVNCQTSVDFMEQLYLTNVIEVLNLLDIESEYWWLSGEKHHFSVPRSGAMLRLLAKKQKSAIVGELNVCRTSRDLLKEKLNQLQCHFTWRPQKETIDLDDLMLKLQDSLTLGVKYQAASYNHLAFVNCLQGNFEEAIENLKEAEKILREEYKDGFKRRSIITYGNFAWVHYHMGQLTEAQSYLDKLEMICKPLSDGPRYTAMIPEVYGEKGWSLLNSAAEYYEEAKECFAKALEQDPDNTEWIMGYATALSRLESMSGTPESRDQSQSVKYFRRVLELDPNDAVAMVLLALKLQRLRQNEEANELVEQALQRTSDLPCVLRYAAKYYRQRGSVEKTIELLKKALELSPYSCFIHHQLGLCYRSKLVYSRSRYRRNLEFQQKAELINLCKYHFEKSFQHRRRSAIQPQLDFAQICITSEEYSRAEETYHRLVELVDIRPENMQRICLEAGLFELYQKKSETNAVRLFLKGAKIECNSSEWEECCMNLEKWADRKLRINAHDSKALGIKAILYQLKGIKGKATEYFEKALKFDPGNEEYVSALSQLTSEHHWDV